MGKTRTTANINRRVKRHKVFPNNGDHTSSPMSGERQISSVSKAIQQKHEKLTKTSGKTTAKHPDLTTVNPVQAKGRFKHIWEYDVELSYTRL